jgi:hypothetical protein
MPVNALILMFAVCGAMGVFAKLREEEFLSRFSKTIAERDTG